MGKFIDITGQMFARLTAIRPVGKDYTNATLWECACLCGAATTTTVTRLRAGKTRSCGCLQRESVAVAAKKLRTTHGLTGTPAHRSWEAMRRRCNNPNVVDYRSYGGRGITVCERWNLFANFVADMGQPPNGTSLDRIDVNGNYEPGNCRWATSEQQADNRQDTIWYLLNGERVTEKEAARRLGLTRSLLSTRRYRGKPLPEPLMLASAT